MKDFNLSQFLGYCVISVGIIIGCAIIGNQFPSTQIVPSNLSVTTSDGTIKFHEYLSKDEACDYLTIGNGHLTKLIDDGKLKGCYTNINGLYVFNRDKLSEAFNKLME